MYQLAKWAIWNVAQATNLDFWMDGRGDSGVVLVAPSNIWTKGYELKARHAMARATSKQKDLRECETMIWFHSHHPANWVKLPDYLESL